ncbi:nuclear pore complex protein Nup50 [Leptidea sinapis]|uniref:nuclear pore complex protein Nup50 n=1 Tax=Leptidea sinapis TaxID=189913 RepID=UPI0021322D27|nr:nuclear pore complex protein Nup50 [Leptidea sinapis]
MSNKRQASTELNHENWDQEDVDEPDDTEGFKMASKEVLEKRVRRVAKRRSNISSNTEKPGVFSGFGGFNKVQKSSFDFLANLTNGANTNKDTSNKQEPFKLNPFVNKPIPSTEPSNKQNTSPSVQATTSPAQNQQSLFTNTMSSPLAGKSIFTDNKFSTNVNESPFKIATSTPKTTFNFGTKSESSSNPTSQQSIFGSTKTSSPNIFAPSVSTSFTKSSTLTSNVFPLSTSAKGTNSIENKKETKKEELDDKKLNFYGKLKCLNISLLEWIKKNLDETPLCLLTPIFQDYEKHLKDIQDEYFHDKDIKSNGDKGDCIQKNSNENVITPSTSGKSLFSNSTITHSNPQDKPANSLFGKTSGHALTATSTISSSPNMSTHSSSTSFSSDQTVAKTSPGFKFGVSTAAPSTSSITSSAGFSFGGKTAQSGISSNNEKFNFGITPTTQNASLFSANANSNTNGNTPFSFGVGNKPFSFNSNVQTNNSETKDANDEDEPPNVEYTPLVEENSVYDKKCKIFFKKDGNFIDKGVGTLYIKKVEESNKHQLLVRANTALGNVLLNLIISSSIPTQRMGKNNVMIVCIPTPDTEPPPTPVLIRVKTPEEADDLLEVLNKYKQ